MLLVVTVFGVRPLVALLGKQVSIALAVVAGACLALGLAGVANAGLLATLADEVPGLALLRDGTRYLGGLALFEALAFGLGAERIFRAVRADVAAWAVGIGLVLAPLAVLPDLAWGAARSARPGRLSGHLASRLARRWWPMAGTVRFWCFRRRPIGPIRGTTGGPGSTRYRDSSPTTCSAPMRCASTASRSNRRQGVPRRRSTRSRPEIVSDCASSASGSSSSMRDSTRPTPASELGRSGRRTVFDADDIAVYALETPVTTDVPGSDQLAVGVAWGVAAITVCMAVGAVSGRTTRLRNRSTQRG